MIGIRGAAPGKVSAMGIIEGINHFSEFINSAGPGTIAGEMADECLFIVNKIGSGHLIHEYN